MTEDSIHIEEELHDAAADARATGKRWTKEISVRGSDLMESIGRLGREAAARKITVKSASGKTILQLPLAVGAAGVLLIGHYTGLLLVAAWATRLSILIEYEAPAVESEAAGPEMATA